MADEPNKIIESIKRGWNGFGDWMRENTAHKVIFGFSAAAVVMVAVASAVAGPVASSAIMAIPSAIIDPEPTTDKDDEKTDGDGADRNDSAPDTGSDATGADTPSTATNTPSDANADTATPSTSTSTPSTANNSTSTSTPSTANNDSSSSTSSNSSSNTNNSSSSSGDNSSSSPSSNSAVTPTHTHTWVAKTRTVTDSEAHWETTKQAWDEIVATTDTSCKHYRCSRCGAVGDHNLGEVVHNVSNCTGTLSVITRYDNPSPTTKNVTKHHDAERKWVDAVTHEETYEVCSGCGQER